MYSTYDKLGQPQSSLFSDRQKSDEDMFGQPKNIRKIADPTMGNALSNERFENRISQNSQEYVVEITSSEHLNEILARTKIVIVKYYTNWCGPCKTIEPKFEELASTMFLPNAISFVKINAEKQKDILRLLPKGTPTVNGVPCFHIFKNGVYTSGMIGANIDELKELIRNAKF